MRGVAAIVVWVSLLHPVRVTFWVQRSGEFDLMLKDHMGQNPDRVCGTVTPDGKMWDAMSFRSGGARVAILLTAVPLDQARQALEKVCK